MTTVSWPLTKCIDTNDNSATGFTFESHRQVRKYLIPKILSREKSTLHPNLKRNHASDRTREMVRHLAGLLRRFGKMQKTMVFCVDMDHARSVARLLQDEFGSETGFSNYAVPIISEEGEDGRRALEAFADSDKSTPVVATTAELLSTGVDVPSMSQYSVHEDLLITCTV